MITAQQRTHIAYAVPAKLQRRTGAGGFVGSSAEQHDLAISSDFAVPSFQLLRRNAQCSRKGVRVGQQVEWVTKVDDRELLPRGQFVLQFLWRDANSGYLF